MKRTIHINLNGYAFTIDEDAYEVLKKYLGQIESSFSDKNEAKEIVADIEARISELFQSSRYSSAKVITLKDVEEVIKTMGDPNDFCDADEVENEADEPKATEANFSNRRRLYRDTNNRVIAGVCGGLGAYFDMDPLVFRVIFFIAFLMYGLAFPLYIVLWIVMPKALTLSQKMEMRGGAGYDKWEQNIKRGFNNMKNSKAYEDISNGAARTTDSLGNALRGVIRFIFSVIGIVLMLGTLLFTLSIVVGFTLGITIFDFADFGSYYSTLPNYFIGGGDLTIGIIGVFLVLIIPVLFIFFVGFKLVFRGKSRLGILAVIGLVLWFVGIGMLAITSGKVVKDYRVSSHALTGSDLETKAKTLYLKANTLPVSTEDNEYLFELNKLSIYHTSDDVLVLGEPEIKLVRGDQLHIEVNKKSRGRNHQSAIDNCNEIEYFYIQKDSVLYIDPLFTLKEGAKLRDQRVKVTITVPQDVKVEIDNALVDVVNDQLVDIEP